MTTTYTIPFSVEGTDEDLAFTVLDRAVMGTGLTTVVANGGEETLYRYVPTVGDPSRPTTLRVGHYPPGDRKSTNDSVKIRTVGIRTDGDGVETEFPLEVTVAVADGSHGQVAREEVAALLMMAQSVLIRPVGVGNEASTTMLNRLSFGVSDILAVTPA